MLYFGNIKKIEYIGKLMFGWLLRLIGEMQGLSEAVPGFKSANQAIHWCRTSFVLLKPLHEKPCWALLIIFFFFLLLSPKDGLSLSSLCFLFITINMALRTSRIWSNLKYKSQPGLFFTLNAHFYIFIFTFLLEGVPCMMSVVHLSWHCGILLLAEEKHDCTGLML